MASAELVGKDVVAQFQKFQDLAKTPKFTPTANGKLVKDAFEPTYKKYDIKAICEGSAFPAVQDKATKSLPLTQAKVTEYLMKVAHEVAKKKTKNTKLDKDAQDVKDIFADLVCCVGAKGPQVKQVKQSATGNVGGLTDTAGYTGSHAQRFDDSGKGKGKAGRVDEASGSGYVGNYKGEGTYDTK